MFFPSTPGSHERVAMLSVATRMNIRVSTQATTFHMTVSLPRAFRGRNNSVYQTYKRILESLYLYFPEFFIFEALTEDYENFSALKLEDIPSSESLVNLYKTVTLNIPKDNNLHQSTIYVHNLRQHLITNLTTNTRNHENQISGNKIRMYGFRKGVRGGAVG